MGAACAWCEAPRVSGAVCPQCGADYAKAEAIRKTGKASVAPEAGQQSRDVQNTADIEPDAPAIPVQDPAWEKALCLFALPGMLLFALLVQVTGFLAGMQRIFFAMPVHEFGHAVTGWLCGFNSIPTLWKTITPEDRGYLSSILLIIGFVAIARYGLKHKQTAWLAGIGIALLVQGYCTLAITESKADMFITIGGDLVGMILATLLMGIFYVGKDTQLYKGSLRWGFLGIGAAAFMNIYAPWWKKNISEIGYGLTGGIPTDSWKMINIHLWQWESLFNIHIGVGIACLVFLAVVYALGLKQVNAWATEKARFERLARIRGK